MAPREKLATTDRAVAETLLAKRLRELHEGRKNRVLLGTESSADLADFASHHLVLKAKSGNFTRKWLQESEHHLRRAVEFFGGERDLISIRVDDVQRFSNWLLERPSPRGGTLSAGTVRHHLNSLSNLFRRAEAEGCVVSGWNPVASLLDKPVAPQREAAWLEVHEGALLLEATRRYLPQKRDPIQFMYPLLGVFLLSGGRKREVLGLEVGDVSFDRKTIAFRPNQFRTLKTRAAHRSVPLFPQTEEILRDYIFNRDSPMEGGLLFPSPRTGGMIHDTRKALDAIATRAGWQPGEIRLHMLRHTFCAARIQCLDRGAPISPLSVAKELGHGGDSLVRRVYSHLGEVRHRSEVLEYRVENHTDILAERLAALPELASAKT